MNLRVVFDTNSVVSALLFSGGQLAWLRDFWQRGEHQSLVSRPTVQELIRVLAYPKFRLSEDEIQILLGDYIPYVQTVELPVKMVVLPQCRDGKDQMFIELAMVGEANVLVSGDADLLEMADACPFVIGSPGKFRHRIMAS